MNLDELRKIAEDTKSLVGEGLWFKDDADLIEGMAGAVLALLDRVEKAEQELGRYDRRLERTESEYSRLETSHSILERALQRVRELHQETPCDGGCIYGGDATPSEWGVTGNHCSECTIEPWPCPTIRALEGDE